MLNELHFSDVDNLCFAATKEKCDALLFHSIKARRLGPLLELIHMSLSGLLPMLSTKQTATQHVASLVNAICSGSNFWSGPTPIEQVGLMHTEKYSEAYENRLWTFLSRARSAGQKISGLPKTVSNKLAAAIGELANNINEHSHNQESGLVAFRAEESAFEFVVADHGIGILESLRSNEEYLELRDEGTALHAALTDGVSRLSQKPARGFGFNPIFSGLMDQYGELRYRSGDHALAIESVGPDLATAKIAQKSPIKGFLASVRCTA